MNSVCLVLSLATSFKWEVYQMDVKSAFLHGDLHEEIYMEQPIGFIQTDSSLVYRLKKSLYGLKQAPRDWYAKMDSFLLESGFSRFHSDNIVYSKKEGKFLIILVLYVDDLILTGSDPNLINHVKSSLKKKFEMTDLGHLYYFLGLQVLQSKEGIFLSQSNAEASPLLVGFTDSDWAGDPDDWKSTASYVFTLGSGTITWACKKQAPISLSSAEAEYHGCHRGYDPDDRKSIASYVFTLGSGPITWACKKQGAISFSSAEAEYHGAVEASKEALWLREILLEFGFQQQHPTTLWCDNQSAIQLCKDIVQHQHRKHIELHMHFIRKLIHDHVLEVQYCSTDDQVVDIFTNALTEAKFTKLRFMVGV
eukprot:PITA_03946